MILTIENEELKVSVDTFGAQLSSVYGKKTGTEYLWQGNPLYWKNRAPILFPICGRLFGGKYLFDGKEYEMPIHGIAKLNDFKVAEKSGDSLVLEFSSDEKTKTFYPFDFRFKVLFSLIGSEFVQKFTVINDGDKVMPFSLGLHPGFNVPIEKGEKFDDYYIEFKKKESKKAYVFSDAGFDTGAKKDYPLDGGKLSLSHSLFEIDGVFLETKDDVATLKSRATARKVSVKYGDMTAIGFWHTPKSDAPFICIEPWHGLPDADKKTGELADKKGVIKLEKGGRYDTEVVITLG